MKTKNLLRNIMSSIEAVVLSPLYILMMLMLWLVVIPMNALYVGLKVSARWMLREWRI